MNKEHPDSWYKWVVRMEYEREVFPFIRRDGTLYYDHTLPFHLWKIDSWEDKEYWELLKMMSTAITKGIDLYDFNFLRRQYGERNEKSKDSGRKYQH